MRQSRRFCWLPAGALAAWLVALVVQRGISACVAFVTGASHRVPGRSHHTSLRAQRTWIKHFGDIGPAAPWVERKKKVKKEDRFAGQIPEGLRYHEKKKLRKKLEREERQNLCVFTQKSQARGTTGRGKADHFHLLDRYIRRVDELLPEDMEHLVQPLEPPRWDETSQVLKVWPSKEVMFRWKQDQLTFRETPVALATEEDVLELFANATYKPLQVLIWQGLPKKEYAADSAYWEAMILFESNGHAREAKSLYESPRDADGEILAISSKVPEILGVPMQLSFGKPELWWDACEQQGVDTIDNPRDAKIRELVEAKRREMTLERQFWPEKSPGGARQLLNLGPGENPVIGERFLDDDHVF